MSTTLFPYSAATFFSLTKGSLAARLPRRPWRVDHAHPAEMVNLRLSADGRSLHLENPISRQLLLSLSLSELTKIEYGNLHQLERCYQPHLCFSLYFGSKQVLNLVVMDRTEIFRWICGIQMMIQHLFPKSPLKFLSIGKLAWSCWRLRMIYKAKNNHTTLPKLIVSECSSKSSKNVHATLFQSNPKAASASSSVPKFSVSLDAVVDIVTNQSVSASLPSSSSTSSHDAALLARIAELESEVKFLKSNNINRR